MPGPIVPDVVVERREAIVVVMLNRPDANNSITPDMFAGLYQAWIDADRDPDCRAIITTHAGDNFSVGADSEDLVSWLERPLRAVFEGEFQDRQGLPPEGDGEEEGKTLGMNRWAWHVAQIATPMIAVMQGIVAGGGLGLALLHHFRFAAPNVRFTTAFGRLGLSFELGMSKLLPELVGRQAALDMALTSRLVDADEAMRLGLIDRQAPEADLFLQATQYAELLARQPPLAVRAMIDAMLAPRQRALRQAMEDEYRVQQRLWESRDFRHAAAELFGQRSRRLRDAHGD